MADYNTLVARARARVRKKRILKEELEKAEKTITKNTKTLANRRSKLARLHAKNISDPDILYKLNNIGKVLKQKDPVTGKTYFAYQNVTIKFLADAVPTTRYMVEMYIKKGLIPPLKLITSERAFRLAVMICQAEERKSTDLGLLKRRLKQLEQNEEQTEKAETWTQAKLYTALIEEKNKLHSVRKRMIDRKGLLEVAQQHVEDHMLFCLPTSPTQLCNRVNRWIKRGTFPKPTAIETKHFWYNPPVVGQIIQMNLELEQEGGLLSPNFEQTRRAMKGLFGRTKPPKPTTVRFVK